MTERRCLSQSWFWTEEWQQMEREVDEDIAAGCVVSFPDVESFLADLDKPIDNELSQAAEGARYMAVRYRRVFEELAKI